MNFILIVIGDEVQLYHASKNLIIRN